MIRLVLVAGLALGVGVARAEVVDVGGWKVEKSESSGKATCTILSISDDKKGGFLMGVNAADFAFIGLVDTDLTLADGDKFQVSYHVDGDAPSKVGGIAAGSNTYLVPLGSWRAAQGVFDSVSAGRAISLDVGGESYEYSLTGSKAAIASFDDCAASIGLPRP